jgi:hypothetical protein
MVLTKEELVASLQNEVRILMHLAAKVDRAKLDYRPMPKQRTTLELLQYMAIMGPTELAIIKSGVFDQSSLASAFSPAEAAAKELTFDQALAAIQKQSDDYARILGSWTEADFRGDVDVFGRKFSCGYMIVNLVVSGFAAYRTQLFCYLKACGREELSTSNLWGGMDPVRTAA